MNKIPELFIAKNKLGESWIYAFLGKDEEEVGCGYIHLFNLNFQDATNVENEWFNQRTITPLKENGKLCVSLDSLIDLTFDIGKSYYEVGNRYLSDGNIYTLKKISNDIIFFMDMLGDELLIPFSKCGTFLPFVASEEMAIKKLEEGVL